MSGNCIFGVVSEMTDPDLKPTFYFDRYINGVKMAEGVCVQRATSLSMAMVVASKIASRGPNGEAPVLVYHATPTAIREATLREAAAVCDYVIKNIDILKADGETYETPRVQKIARGLVDVARQDILALIEKGAAE